ncbi:NADP-dependent oxidoreductase [Actinokineospora sp. HBU206404]|uniref:NADP-dependent oxidoreductase n=1 Tax=Actinokineospora xionganensis TaxID=2684470 RepID=A0ABR7KZ50_9PSEU|nr:NADP-dependent oxidoreductase [Actinokineospora xionganensis]
MRLAARPVGLPDESSWQLTEEPVGTPGAGEVLVRTLCLSLDPAMRGWMNDVRSYIPPVGIGEVMRAAGVGRVVASGDERFAEGAYISGAVGVQEYAVLRGDDLLPVDLDVAPPARWLGALGMSGMTAYFGLLDVGAPKEGDVVVVSGAAGATGSLVGQIAKLKGCKVIGIAGGADKCRWLVDELGFDAAIDYKSDDLKAALKEHAPKGVDVYFDNVGGEMLDTVLARLARGARVVICGAISQYNATESVHGPKNYMQLLVARARMEGFVVFDYANRFREAAKELAGWIAEGKLVAREDIVDGGVDAFPATLNKLFGGENTGKLILRLAD